MDKMNNVIGVIMAVVMLAIIPGVAYSVINTTDEITSSMEGATNMEMIPDYIVFKYDDDTVLAKNCSSNEVDYRSTNFSDLMFSVTNRSDSTVYIKGGQYEMEYKWSIPDNTTIIGEGRSTVISGDHNIMMWNTKNVLIRDLVTDHTRAFYIKSEGGECSNITLKNIVATANENTQAAFEIFGIEGNRIHNITLDNCVSYYSHTFGFINHDHPSDSTVLENITYRDCKAIGSGLHSPRYNDWTVGFDVRESGILKDVTYENCIATHSWESGFHNEIHADSQMTNVKLTNCKANNNGLKPDPGFGHGIIITDNMRVVDSEARYNAESNFYIQEKEGEGSHSMLQSSYSTGGKYGIRVQSHQQNVTVNDVVVTANDSNKAAILVDESDNYMSSIDISAHVTTYGDTEGFRLLSSEGISASITATHYDSIGTRNLFGHETYQLQNSTLECNIKSINGDVEDGTTLTVGGDDLEVSGYIKSSEETAIKTQNVRNVHIHDMQLYMTSESGGQTGIREYSTDPEYRDPLENVWVTETKIVNTADSSQHVGIGRTYSDTTITVRNVEVEGSWSHALDIVSFITYSDTATISNGDDSVTVNHRLYTTPETVIVTGDHSEVSTLWVDSIDDSTFTVHCDGNVTDDRTIYWEASAISSYKY